VNDRPNDPVDLSALDPTRDPARLERTVQAILDRAAPELARRRRGSTGILAELAGWRRPVLAAAAVVLVLGAGLLAGYEAIRPGSEETALTEAIGVPRQLAGWVAADGDRLPSAAAVLFGEPTSNE